MNKFEERRRELKNKLDKELERIEQQEQEEIRKIVAPMASKFSALMSEELEGFGKGNPEAISEYKFQKAAVRKLIKVFIEDEFGATKNID
jgi:hypothetical protein